MTLSSSEVRQPLAGQRRRLLALSLGVVLAAMGFLLPAPAAAAAGEIEVSYDNVTYSPTLPTPLFSSIALHVPGDTQTATFYVRNSGATDARFRLTLHSVTVSDPALANALTVSASPPPPGTPGADVSMASAKPCRVLMQGQVIAKDDYLRVTAVLKLGDLQGLAGQGATATFSLRVSLSDSAAPLPPDGCDPGGTDIPGTGGNGSIPLATTGTEVPLPLIMGTAAVLGVGLFLILAARRRRKDEE